MTRKLEKMTAAVLVLCIGVSICGCRKTPSKTIVQNKDFDKMVKQANQGDDGKSVLEKTGDVQKYQTEIKDDTLHVNVKVDARVEIPDIDKMSVIRISKKELSQEFLDNAIKVLEITENLYDGSDVETRWKSEVEADMQSTKRDKNNFSEEEYEMMMKGLQEEYKKAPESVDFSNKAPSDKKIHNINEMPDTPFYEWEKSISPDMDIFYGVTDAKNGDYKTIYMQNNTGYGNAFRYRKSKHGYIFTSSPYTGSDFKNLNTGFVWSMNKDRSVSELVKKGNPWIEEDEYFKDEKCTISEEEAIKQGNEMIQKLGIADMELSRSEFCGLSFDIRRGTEHGKGECYLL